MKLASFWREVVRVVETERTVTRYTSCGHSVRKKRDELTDPIAANPQKMVGSMVPCAACEKGEK